MKTFQEHINKEEGTIKEFVANVPNMEIRNIMNEGYCRYDFSFKMTHPTIPNKLMNGLCEVKTRTIASDKYEGGAMLELDKVTSIAMKVAEIKNDPRYSHIDLRVFFLCKYTDKTLLWDLSKVNLGNIKMVNCPKSSSFDGSREYMIKPVLNFALEDATIVIDNK